MRQMTMLERVARLFVILMLGIASLSSMATESLAQSEAPAGMEHGAWPGDTPRANTGGRGLITPVGSAPRQRR